MEEEGFATIGAAVLTVEALPIVLVARGVRVLVMVDTGERASPVSRVRINRSDYAAHSFLRGDWV